MKEFPCNVSGCSAVFHTLVDFEIHYNGAHRFTCLECGKIKSNARLLEIHIQELHNCFFKLLAEKKPMVSNKNNSNLFYQQIIYNYFNVF